MRWPMWYTYGYFMFSALTHCSGRTPGQGLQLNFAAFTDRDRICASEFALGSIRRLRRHASVTIGSGVPRPSPAAPAPCPGPAVAGCSPDERALYSAT